jgi:hypothetical protein
MGACVKREFGAEADDNTISDEKYKKMFENIEKLKNKILKAEEETLNRDRTPIPFLKKKTKEEPRVFKEDIENDIDVLKSGLSNRKTQSKAFVSDDLKESTDDQINKRKK